MSNQKSRKITIFDTTLRDGEQSPGASMNLAEKLEVAGSLVDLGVDVMEAGFPIASPGDFEAVQTVARNIKGSRICGLARCRPRDIDTAWDALKEAEQPRIHTFLATSAIHREYKLKMGPDEIIERAAEGVRRARNLCDDIEFSPEDACRTEIDFLCRVVEAAIEAGASTINIPDTVGYTTPGEMRARIETLRERVPNIDKAVLSVHCHNDLGMAVANSLAAVQGGAGQIECTINGIGERAGNCSLEEVVMAMRTREDYYGMTTGIVTQKLVPTSRIVAKITGLRVQRNKAIVGQNAFAHEAGIHQDGMLKERTTYEIMRPEDVGLEKSDLILGKHSGRAALAERARILGHELTNDQVAEVFEAFKKLADLKKEVYDADLLALIQNQIRTMPVGWSFEKYQLHCGDGKTPEVTLTLDFEGEKRSTTVAAGDGPIDAVFLAIRELINLPQLECKDYNVHSVTVGQDAQGEVVVQMEHNGNLFRGMGVSTDTVEASAQAFLNAVNRILDAERSPSGP